MQKSRTQLDSAIQATWPNEEETLQSRTYQTGRILLGLVAVIGIGLLVTVVLYRWARRWEANEIARTFEQAARGRVAVLKEEVEELNETLGWMASLYRSSQQVERSEFETFISSYHMLDHHVVAAKWIPLVTDEQRQQYEQAARDDGLEDFHFKEIGPQGELVLAEKRPRYYPVYFIVPQQPHSGKLGLDLGADQDTGNALSWACDHDRTVIAGHTSVVYAGQDGHELLLARPVYRNGASTASEQERRENLVGFVALRIRMESMLGGIARATDDKLDLFVYEQHDGHDRFLGLHTSAIRRHSNAIPEEIRRGVEMPAPVGIYSDTSIDVADSQWRLICVPTPAFTADAATHLARLILAMGLGLTLLTTSLMRVASSRASERQRAADALSASHEQFKTLFESSKDAIMTLTAEEGFLSGNQATAELFGTGDVGNFVSRHPAELSPEFQPDGRSSVVKAQEMMRIALDEGSNFFEWRHKTLAGHEFDATVLLTRMEIRGRTMLQATVRDVTEQKQTEQRIREHREMMEVIFHVAPYGMILISEDLKIKKTNEAAAKLVGRKESEVLDQICGSGLGCVNAIRAEGGCGRGELCSQCFLRKSAEGVFLTGEPISRTQMHHTFVIDGQETPVWLEISIEPLTFEWKNYAIVVVTNVTEQKEAYEAKGRFLANMSHEIRTPMNAVMGFSDILAAEPLSEEQRSYVNSIRTSGRHLLRVIDDILDFSKIEAGKLEIDPIDCDLAEILGGIESLASFRAGEKDLKFAINAADDLPAKLHTDPDRITQCLINLVNNAVKFTAEGHVHLNVSMEDDPAGPLIRFDVEDTGIGIPAGKLEKIFESFTQSDGGTSRQYGGTGLGLAITRQLAGLLGGRVEVRSKEGVGSVFSLIVPTGVDVDEVAKMGPMEHRATAVPVAVNAQCSFRGRVLVAEDTVTNQVLIRSLLEKMGLDVTIVDNGQKAVEAAGDGQFDLIFMDMQMPVMNGYDATRKLRKQQSQTPTPIVALTALAIKGDDTRCFDAGCDDYLSKPIDSSKLRQVLARHLAAEPAASG